MGEDMRMAILTSIILKKFKGNVLNEYEREYVAGMIYEFDRSSEEEQESMMSFTDSLQAEIEKQKGRLN